MHTDQLISVPNSFGPSGSSSRTFVGSPASPRVGALLLDRGDLQIRLATTQTVQNISASLVARMYSWRGYRGAVEKHVPKPPPPTEATLQVCRGDTVFGTLTLRFDSEQALAADALYGAEIDSYRRTGARLAELTRLAVDPEFGSKEALGSLFHAAYVMCGPVRGITNVFIEVNPRHVAFYRRMLHFEMAGEQRMCARVDAPAILMHVAVAHVGEQAARFGGAAPGCGRSLYPYFCSSAEEQELLRALLMCRFSQPASNAVDLSQAALNFSHGI